MALVIPALALSSDLIGGTSQVDSERNIENSLRWSQDDEGEKPRLPGTSGVYDIKGSVAIASKTEAQDINKKIADTWVEITIELISDGEEKWVAKTITKAERYLLALYNDTEYRNIITSYLMIVRNNSDTLMQSNSVRNILARSLSVYSKSARTTSDRMNFLRVLRAAGVSPLGR